MIKVTIIEREAAVVGLALNHHKSGLICADQTGLALLQLAPELCRVNPNTAHQLVHPLMKHYLIKWKLSGK